MSLESFDAPALVELIRTDLGQTGWHHCRSRLSLEQCDAVCQLLGPIEGRHDIVLDAEQLRAQRPGGSAEASRPSTYSPAALDLHTDRPTAEWLAWYCVRQDAQDGSTRFIDTASLLDALPEEDVRELAAVPVVYRSREPGGEVTRATEPMLTMADGRRRLYYAPWLVESAIAERQQAAVQRFARGLAAAAEHTSWLVRLEPGESIFIDNRRLMHGRGPLAPDSRRHLVRFAIQRPAAA